MKNRKKPLNEGHELLADRELCALLSAVAERVGVLAEEYLLRFDEALQRDPSALTEALEKA